MGWSQLELAEAASVGVATVRRLEAAETQIRGSVYPRGKFNCALEAGGWSSSRRRRGRGPASGLSRPGIAGASQKSAARPTRGGQLQQLMLHGGATDEIGPTLWKAPAFDYAGAIGKRNQASNAGSPT